jgi:hypothetical protein
LDLRVQHRQARVVAGLTEHQQDIHNIVRDDRAHVPRKQ